MGTRKQLINKSGYFYILVFLAWISVSTSVYAAMLTEKGKQEETTVCDEEREELLQTFFPEEEAEEKQEPFEVKIFDELGEEVFSWFVNPTEGINDLHLLRYLNRSSFVTETQGMRIYVLHD